MIVRRLREAAAWRRARWESLCLRCGGCCYGKEIRGGSVLTNVHRPCTHLDRKTRLCSVYETRFSACAACRPMTLRHALFVRWLPENCGYVLHFRGRFLRHSGGRFTPAEQEGLHDGGGQL